MADIIHAQPVSDGGVDFQGFLGDATFFVARHIAYGFHVVQTISQFDDDNPQVFGHGQKHFSDIFGLGFRAGAAVDLGKFGYPVHQIRNFRAELFA